MKKTFILVILVFLLSTCKKYPENTLWFKNINKIKFFDNVKLTGYKVNGIDSLLLLNNYFGSRVAIKDINSTYFEDQYDTRYGSNIGIFQMPYLNIEVPYGYSKNKKQITIWFNNEDTMTFRRILFPDSKTAWEIIKLDPKGTRKIKKTVNDNTYELQFDKI